MLFVVKKNQFLLKIRNSTNLIRFETTSLKWRKSSKNLLTWGKFMPELHLKQPGFTCSACRTFTKHSERIQKFRETGTLKHSYRDQLDKGYFAHDAAHSDSKDLDKKIISDKILKVRVYEITKNHKYDGYQRTYGL